MNAGVSPHWGLADFSSAALDLTLAGAVTTATVTPIDGSVAVSVTAQIEIQSEVPIDPATVTAEHVRLVRLDVAQGFPGPSGVEGSPAVPAQLILSGSGRTLALVPDARLDPATPASASRLRTSPTRPAASSSCPA